MLAFKPEMPVGYDLCLTILSIVIAVAGIGIAPEDIAKAFESFVQIDSRLSRRYEGAGLGLPQFVTLHGRTTDIQSAPKQGTAVTVTFPAERVILHEDRAAA